MGGTGTASYPCGAPERVETQDKKAPKVWETLRGCVWNDYDSYLTPLRGRTSPAFRQVELGHLPAVVEEPGGAVALDLWPDAGLPGVQLRGRFRQRLVKNRWKVYTFADYSQVNLPTC